MVVGIGLDPRAGIKTSTESIGVKPDISFGSGAVARLAGGASSN